MGRNVESTLEELFELMNQCILELNIEFGVTRMAGEDWIEPKAVAQRMAQKGCRLSLGYLEGVAAGYTGMLWRSEVYELGHKLNDAVVQMDEKVVRLRPASDLENEEQ